MEVGKIKVAIAKLEALVLEVERTKAAISKKLKEGKGTVFGRQV